MLDGSTCQVKCALLVSISILVIVVAASGTVKKHDKSISQEVVMEIILKCIYGNL